MIIELQIFLTALIAAVVGPFIMWIHWVLTLAWFIAVVTAVVYGIKIIWGV
jgi:hypothetical protein